LRTWLEPLGLAGYADVLIENDVDLEVLPQLDDGDLKELGFSLGHRRKLLAALRSQAPSPPEALDQVLQDTAAPIQAGLAQGTPVQASREAERRQLTVMFCDLVGSTRLSERLDPEELRGVMQRYHDAVAAAVMQFDGHVAKLMGDGVLAYFGWPAAHEDDAERAVRAALGAVGAVGRIEVAEETLAARVGIATGPVVIGDMTSAAAKELGAVVGATPNLAARLQGLSEPGEVLISQATRRLVGESFELADAGSHSLKGFANAVSVWRVKAAARRQSRFETYRAGEHTAFVGRARDLALLKANAETARQGHGRAVLISGEAGLGKSRILHELTSDLAQHEWRILRYHCLPYEVNAAFYPFLSELEESAGFASEDSPERRLGKLKDHLVTVPLNAEDALPLLASMLALPLEDLPELDPNPQRRKQRSIALLAERLERLSLTTPLLVLFEDLHWIDPSSLETLDRIIRAAPSSPLLIVSTFRPEFEASWDSLDHVATTKLDRLTDADVKAIAARVSGGKTLPDEVIDHIEQHADGVPLFVEELTKSLLDAGFLQEEETRYSLIGALAQHAVPTTLHDSLMARLDRLAPEKQVIQAAACVGRSFDRELLAAVCPLAADHLKAALDKLVAAQLIFPSGPPGGSSYIFKHALLQDAAYNSLLNSARRLLHEKLAAALAEQRAPDPLQLARHYAGAGAFEAAARLYLKAGQHSLHASALPEAIGALDLGLQAQASMPAAPARDRLELDLRVALGAARMAQFGWAHGSVAEALEPAFPLAMAADNPDAVGSILWGLWVHYQTRTEFPRAHAWLDALKNAAEAGPDTDLPVIYEMSAGCQDFWEADYARAIGHTDHLKSRYDVRRHARIAALTNHDPLVFSQHWAGSLADWIRGYPERSLARMEEALDLARSIGHPFNLVFALTAGSTCLFYLNEADWLLRNCDEAQRVVHEEALGPFSEHVNVMQWRGAGHILRGDYEEGYDVAKQGNDFWSDSGGRICTAMFRGWMVLGLQGLGRMEEALRLNEDNIAHCRRTGDRYMEPESVRQRGELLLAADPGQAEAAARHFQDAIAIAERQGARSWALRAALSQAHYLERRDRRREALACLEPRVAWFREGLESADLRQAQVTLARLG